VLPAYHSEPLTLTLSKSIEEAHEAQEQAREAMNLAFAKEMRLRQQLDLLEKREAEAIAVEESSIEQAESSANAEVLQDMSFSTPGFSLSPSTWNALDGGFDLGAEFWGDPGVSFEIPNSQPEISGTSGRAPTS
jgi:hypothetical protein